MNAEFLNEKCSWDSLVAAADIKKMFFECDNIEVDNLYGFREKNGGGMYSFFYLKQINSQTEIDAICLLKSVEWRELNDVYLDMNDMLKDYWLIKLNADKFFMDEEYKKAGIDPNRKDYCFSCHNDNLVWVYMAGRCSMCQKVLIGG